MSQPNLSALIWSVADLLRGDYKPADYGKVILPFTVLRRLDCVLAPTKAAVLAEKAAKEAAGINPEPFLQRLTKLPFANTSDLDLKKLMGDQDNLAANLAAYIQGFSPAVRDVFERFRFAEQIDRLQKAGLLYQVAEKFSGFNLSPDAISNHDMGLAFEVLIRKFAEISNETAGEHFTPREVIRLMVNLIFIEDSDILTPGNPVVRTIYDPTAGTGGMLSVAGEHLAQHNPASSLTMFGQELNDESYAICKADMLIKGQDVRNVVAGNTLSDDGHAGRKFDYMLSNPPFGVEWKKVEKEVRKEAEQMGHAGRFGPGLPRISDGSLLFLLHLISKMRPAQEGGSRIGIVLNGSPLFTGGAGSGESEIRRYVLENDLVEAIIALPTDMFFNTGISTYVWILCNRKPAARRGHVQLIDASSLWQKMRKSLGSKRREMGEADIDAVSKLFGDCVEARLATITTSEGKATTEIVREGEAPPAAPEGGSIKFAPLSRIFKNEAFGYRTITVERPLRKSFQISKERAIKILEAKLILDYPSLRNAQKLINVIDNLTYYEIVKRLGRVFYLTGIDRTWMNQADFSKEIKQQLKKQKLELTTPVINWIIDSFGEVNPEAEPCLKAGRPVPDASLRDTENVPLSEDVATYFAREVLPHAPDAWIDEDKTKVGYEIPFNRHFYVFEPPRPLDVIDAELKQVTDRILAMISGLAA